ALLKVLTSAGLFRDGDDPDMMLGQLCWNFGFSPGILISMLESATAAEVVPPVDITPFRNMPMPDLVTHIEEVHHVFLRQLLPRLTELTAAASADSPDDRRLSGLSTEMCELAEELLVHLAHEEEALFPLIRSLAAGEAVPDTRCGSSVGGPIACMENDHDTASRVLQRMRELTDGYTVPAAASAMLEGLRDLDQDLRVHMYKENALLFPGALALQRNAGRGNLRPSEASPQVQ
ncbi:MAG: hemerythrin domain-containing protein, partial [Gammaproteobacteria bacterium]|nr:hemerythrin domain-containing protein [Gammaproteobacteria bacterium]